MTIQSLPKSERIENAQPEPKLEPITAPTSPTSPLDPLPTSTAPISIRWLTETPAADPSLPVAAILAALPPSTDNWENPTIESGYSIALNSAGSRHLVFLRWAFEGTLMVVERGKVIGQLHGAPMRISDVGVFDFLGDEALEIVVHEIEGSSLSSYPTWSNFYRVTGQGEIEFLARVGESSRQGAKCPVFIYKNEITFPKKGTVQVINRDWDADYQDDVELEAEWAERRTDGLAPRSGPRPESERRGPAKSFALVWDSKAQTFAQEHLTQPENGPAPHSFGVRATQI